MIQRLSSTRLAWYTIVVLILLLAWGIFLATAHNPIFKSLNHINLTEWLVLAGQTRPIAVIWFIALCIAAGILLINGLCCGLTRLVTSAIRTRSTKQWMFLALHLLFLLVLGCHGLALILTQKHSQVTLYAGQRIDIMGRQIQVKAVIFNDDITILTTPKPQQRKMMTTDQMNLRHNKARITLFNDQGSQAADLYMLSPYRDRFFQATITEFTYDTDRGEPGITLNFTKNYFNLFFFSVYAVMILTLAGFTAITWKTPHKGDHP